MRNARRRFCDKRRRQRSPRSGKMFPLNPELDFLLSSLMGEKYGSIIDAENLDKALAYLIKFLSAQK